MDRMEIAQIIGAVKRHYPTWKKHHLEWERTSGASQWRKSAQLMKECEAAINWACIESGCQRLTIYAIFKEIYNRELVNNEHQ